MDIYNHSNHHLFTADTLSSYIREKTDLFFGKEKDNLMVEEIGDGNINYVFRVHSPCSGKRIIVKQADKLLRSSGRPLDITRSKREAAVLQLYAKDAAAFVPHVYCYDEVMSAIIMEDVSPAQNLRKILMTGKKIPLLAEQLSSFLVDAVIRSSSLFINPQEKKERIKQFTNPELCAISETLVFCEPYCNNKNRNCITAGNESFVEQYIYGDSGLHAEIGLLREIFMNNSQALIHGDLHSGSVFVTNSELKVIDPEFAFYGPIGYDLGNCIAHFYLAWMYAIYSDNNDAEFLTWLENTATTLPNLFFKKFLILCTSEALSSPVYNTEFLQRYARQILADTYGFAGTELIRRIIGDTKTAELDNMQKSERRKTFERIVLQTAIMLIKERSNKNIGAKGQHYFKMALSKYH